jgi:tetratricopeptide (TPR) repeat protein
MQSRVPRVVLQRMAAVVLVPLALLLVVEGALRLFGYGYPTSFFLDGPKEGPAVRLNNPKYGWRFFGPALARECWPFAFPADKSPEVIRIFVLGESAAMGDPDPRFGLPRMLEALLSQRFPRKRFEIVSTAFSAINSHVILPIAKECADEDGDLWVIYMGNNEVEGPFGTGSVLGRPMLPLSSIRASLWFKRTRVGQMIDALLRRVGGEANAPEEWGGMEMLIENKVRQSDPRLERVYGRFQANLRDILTAGERAGVAVVLSTVGVNLRHCAPFASLHNEDLADAQLDSWQALYQTGVVLQGQGDHSGALVRYRQAFLIDPEYGELLFRMASCLEAIGEIAEARDLYQKALEADVLRFRADTRLNEIVRLSAERRPWVRLFDAEAALARQSPGGMSGGEFFYDHVHLTPSGNYIVARGIAGEVVAALGLNPGLGEESVENPGMRGHDSVARADTPLGESIWPSESECMRWLGLTDRNRISLLTKVLRRRASPPFSDQLNHEAELRRLTMLLSAHQEATSSPAMLRMVEGLAKLVSSRPGDADLRSNHAAMLQALGRFEDAEREWLEVIQLLPHASQARIALGLLLERQGRLEEAAVQYRQCLELSPRHPQARDRLAKLAQPTAAR